MQVINVNSPLHIFICRWKGQAVSVYAKQGGSRVKIADLDTGMIRSAKQVKLPKRA